MWTLSASLAIVPPFCVTVESNLSCSASACFRILPPFWTVAPVTLPTVTTPALPSSCVSVPSIFLAESVTASVAPFCPTAPAMVSATVICPPSWSTAAWTFLASTVPASTSSVAAVRVSPTSMSPVPETVSVLPVASRVVTPVVPDLISVALLSSSVSAVTFAAISTLPVPASSSTVLPAASSASFTVIPVPEIEMFPSVAVTDLPTVTLPASIRTDLASMPSIPPSPEATSVRSTVPAG